MPAGGSADASWRDAQHPAEGNRLQLRCMPHEGLASGLAICSSAAGLHNLLDRIPVCPLIWNYLVASAEAAAAPAAAVTVAAESLCLVRSHCAH